MSYRINVAYSTGSNWNSRGLSYRHYFAVETTLIVGESGRNLTSLVDSLRAAYPAPEYEVTVARRTSYSEDVDMWCQVVMTRVMIARIGSVFVCIPCGVYRKRLNVFAPYIVGYS